MRVEFGGKGGFDNLDKWLNNTANNTQVQLAKNIAAQGERSLAMNTPKNTGETSAGWVSEITKNGNEIEISWRNKAHPESSASVAKMIDQGHGTGTGGFVLPRPYIRNAMSSVWASAGDQIQKGLNS